MFNFLLFLLLHPYFVSITNIEIKDNRVLQISSEYFIDDMENAIVKQNNTSIKIDLSKKENRETNITFIKNYINDKFSLLINNKRVDLLLVGYEVEDDRVIFFLESVFEPTEIKTLDIANIILCEYAKEQSNVVTLRYNTKEYSTKLNAQVSHYLFKF